MTAPLREVLVCPPGMAFARAFDEPELGFLHAVDIERARREHEALSEALTGLGVNVHVLEADGPTGDAVYVFDPMLVSDRGVIMLRSGKATRVAEGPALEDWAHAHEIPVHGRIEAPGTVDGGDTFWLTPNLLCVGRSLRTNQAGYEQLAEIAGGDVRAFDVPYATGPAECLHLLSLISPVSDELAVAFLPQLPSGLYDLLRDRGVGLVEVPEQEMPTLGCNVLAVEPGVVIMPEGNPITQRALLDHGCEVHTFPAGEIGVNGSGGPTCLTRPIYRDVRGLGS
jgi:N-dimethylarginine dimethylaminohydrolase